MAKRGKPKGIKIVAQKGKTTDGKSILSVVLSYGDEEENCDLTIQEIKALNKDFLKDVSLFIQEGKKVIPPKEELPVDVCAWKGEYRHATSPPETSFALAMQTLAEELKATPGEKVPSVFGGRFVSPDVPEVIYLQAFPEGMEPSGFLPYWLLLVRQAPEVEHVLACDHPETAKKWFQEKYNKDIEPLYFRTEEALFPRSLKQFLEERVPKEPVHSPQTGEKRKAETDSSELQTKIQRLELELHTSDTRFNELSEKHQLLLTAHSQLTTAIFGIQNDLLYAQEETKSLRSILQGSIGSTAGMRSHLEKLIPKLIDAEKDARDFLLPEFSYRKAVNMVEARGPEQVTTYLKDRGIAITEHYEFHGDSLILEDVPQL